MYLFICTLCIICFFVCCYFSSELKPRLSRAPFLCGCLDRTGLCMYSPRSRISADYLIPNSSVYFQAKEALTKASEQQLNMQLSSGKSTFQARINSHMKAILEYEN